MRRPYDSTLWRKLRKQILARDGYECQLRISKKCKGFAEAVDHIVDWRDGGPWFTPGNLQSACNSCNNAKRNKRAAAAVRRERQGEGDTPPPPQPDPGPSRDW